MAPTHEDAHRVSFRVSMAMIDIEAADTVSKHDPFMPRPQPKHTILLIGSNPWDTASLDLSSERNAIASEIRASDQRDDFDIQIAEQIEAGRLPGLIMQHAPRILHFSGHGNEQGELLFCRADGSGESADTNAIANVFGLLGKSIRCVVLNACYSEAQAKLIAKTVDIVVGIRRTVDDRSAIAFSAGFYEALGYNQTFAVAFELGKARIQLTQMPDEDQLVLHCRDGVDPTTATLTTPDLLERFTEGEAGRRRVRDQLQRQSAVDGNAELAATLAEAAEITRFLPGELLIRQGAADCDIYFVLAGEVAVEIQKRAVARRSRGQHVGEMALIDPSQHRSASIRAITETIAAKVSEEAFTRIAARHPHMWRRLAVDLGGRLRERGQLVSPRNEKPVLLVDSTSKGLAVARDLRAALSSDGCVVRLCTDEAPETLSTELSTVDLAVSVIAPDDPRDTVILRMGLMMGALGRERTLMIQIRSSSRDFEALAHRMGVRSLEVASGSEFSAANELRSLLSRLGSR